MSDSAEKNDSASEKVRWNTEAAGMEEEEVVGEDGGRKTLLQPTALIVQSCQLEVTAVTDTTRPGSGR